MKLRIVSMIARAIFLSVILNCTSAFAQLAEPANDLGVRLGHIHLVVKNVEAQTKFWTEMMGGTVVKNGPLTLIQFPGVFIRSLYYVAPGRSEGSAGRFDRRSL